MNASSIIILGIISIYIFVCFTWTQKIYSKNYFKTLSLVSISLIILSYFIITEKYRTDIIRIELVFIYYFALLWIVRLFYKRINEKLIAKNLIDISFKGKDFTYVWSDGEILADPWWDETLAKQPSRLDDVITYLLGLLPLFLAAIPSICNYGS